MYFISLISVWMAVCFFRRFDDIPDAVVAPLNVVLWSAVHPAVFLAVLSHSEPPCAALAAAYLTVAAMIDYHTGYVYSFLSYLSLILCFFFLYSDKCFYDVSCYLIFLGYLKILEMCRAFGGGDTEYLFFIYCFNRLVYGDGAESVTVIILLLAALLHTLCYGNETKQKPFTPQILAAFMLSYIFIV